jgi:uncharacterized membrane protein HdeD (DUF308 family)
MPHPPHRPSRQRDQDLHERLLKGIFIALIGLAVLLAPSFMAASELRTVVADAYLVGWFALLLGGVFIAQAAARRWQDRQMRQHGEP